MSDYTENYNLKKPYPDDFFDVNDFNGNADIIDKALASKLDVNSTDNFAKEASVQEIITKVNTNAKETSLQNLSNKIGNYSDSKETSNSVFSKINSIDTNVDKILNKSSQAYKQIRHQEISFYIQTSVTNCLEINGPGKLIGIMFSLRAAINTGRYIYIKILADNETILYHKYFGGGMQEYCNVCITTPEYAPKKLVYEDNYCVLPGSNCFASTFVPFIFSGTLKEITCSSSETKDYRYSIIDNPIPFNENLIIQSYNDSADTAVAKSFLTVWYTFG